MSHDSARPIRVLGIAGSLRAGSYNKAALRAAIALAPASMTIETFDIAPLPVYNADMTIPPPAVQELIDKVTAADAILFVTPEYNFSIPGGLKNAIDWFSRDPNKGFAGKPVGIMGASGGPLGTARAQYHLRQTCVFLDMHPVNKPEVFIGMAHTKFDAEGNLTDEATKTFIGQLLVSLDHWTRKIGA
ncbi:MAG TPA: NAD(P)H-dependent oxidoreductase [Magnetospirillaceae bacterium]|jgi:chromate reductase